MIGPCPTCDRPWPKAHADGCPTDAWIRRQLDNAPPELTEIQRARIARLLRAGR